VKYMSRIVCWMLGHQWRPASRGGETCDRCRLSRLGWWPDAQGLLRRSEGSVSGRRRSIGPGRHSGLKNVATSKEQQAANHTIAVAQATYPKLERNFNGLDVWQASRLKALEEENARLKKLLADAVLMLNNVNINDLATSNAAMESVLPVRGQRLAAASRLRLLSSDET
jgi:putative transposase